MRAIAEYHPTENSSEKPPAAVQEIRRQEERLQQQARLFLQQLADAETRARVQIAAQDALIGRLQQRLSMLEQQPLSSRLRTQVEEYAAKLAGERVRAERAEASAAQWKRSAMKNGERYLRLQERFAQVCSGHGPLEAGTERPVSPVYGAYTESQGVSPPSACATTAGESRTRWMDGS
ncbi:MAG: hypothetical protein PVJ15_08975 [Gammaproteobacteria bacterium]|jgi:hypothetical protein